MTEEKRIEEAVTHIRENGFEQPEYGIVLGTGLGGLVDKIEIINELEYSGIPNFPVSTVEFHSGKLIYGKLGGKLVVAMQGRFHMYEGYSAKEVAFPIRVMKQLGISGLVLSNAAGGINLEYTKGQLVLIDDHINLLPDNPLIGRNLEGFGERFPDMSQPYDRDFNAALKQAALDLNMDLTTGVYASVVGPNLETRAEYRFLKIIGADLVGMSTVPEVIAANHMGLPCCAVSIVTDLCDPDHLEPVDIQDIIANAAKGEQKLVQLMQLFFERIKA